MEQKKMTIHRALAELKLIDAKIEKQIGEFVPTGTFQKGKLILGYVTEEDFKTNAKSKYDSVTDLIERKSKIKSAIVHANSVTKVEIAGKEMTISDAITQKSTILFKKKLINRMKSVLQISIGDLNKNNEIVESNVQKLLEYTFGNDNVKADAKEMDAVRKPYIESNQFHLADPLKIEKLIEILEKEVYEFEAEVDAVLSEINAVTFISL